MDGGRDGWNGICKGYPVHYSRLLITSCGFFLLYFAWLLACSWPLFCWVRYLAGRRRKRGSFAPLSSSVFLFLHSMWRWIYFTPFPFFAFLGPEPIDAGWNGNVRRMSRQRCRVPSQQGLKPGPLSTPADLLVGGPTFGRGASFAEDSFFFFGFGFSRGKRHRRDGQDQHGKSRGWF